MRLLDLLRPRTDERALSDMTALYTGMGPSPEGLATSFPAFDRGAYKGSPPVFALIAVRARALSEVTFTFRNLESKELEWRPRLDVLRRPWPNGTSADLFAAIEVDVSLSGNAYIRRLPASNPARTVPIERLQRLRPDWVDIVYRRFKDGSTELAGYLYWPDGKHEGRDPVEIDRGDVAHYIEHPDPTGLFRGQSWITAATRDVDSDTWMQEHKGKFFTNAATPNLAVVSKGKFSDDARKLLKTRFALEHQGVANAYEPVFLEGGADVKVLGQSMEQMTFSTVQAAGETRLAAAAEVPPVVVGFLQGIQAATYSNYSQALRRFADLTIRPRWRALAGSLETIMPPPAGYDLWYDDRGIPFLQQDALDAAKIRQTDFSTIESGIRAGFKPDSVVEAVNTNDLTKLDHSGKLSVQLLPDEDVISDDEEPSDDTE